MKSGRFAFAVFCLVAAASCTSCKDAVNSDANKFILSNFRKNELMNFSAAGLSIVSGPLKINYIKNEKWLPGENGKGLSLALKRGGGSQKLFYFNSYNEETSIVTLSAADDSTITLKQDGFNSANLGVQCALTLTLVDININPVSVPELPDEYNWKFKNEGEVISITASLDSAQTMLLYYNVYEGGESTWSISPDVLPAPFPEEGAAYGEITEILVNGRPAEESDNKAHIGDNITVTARSLDLNWLLKGFVFTNANGVAVYVNFTEDLQTGEKRGNFSMPAYNIALSLEFIDILFITVDGNTISGASKPVKLDYAFGEIFDGTGICVKGRKTDGSDIDLTGEADASVGGAELLGNGWNFVEAGTQTVIVTARGLSTSFTVNVTAGNSVAMRIENDRLFLYNHLYEALDAALPADTIWIIKDFYIMEESGTPEAITDEEAITFPAKNITLLARGERTIKRRRYFNIHNKALFTVPSGAAVTLGSSGGGGMLIIDGNNQLPRSSYTESLIKIEAGGSLTMENNSAIKNHNANHRAVEVGGNFYMNGGEISGNQNTDINAWGGAIGVGAGGEFRMYGGEIKNNRGYTGGGVNTYGVFLMHGGKIINNKAVKGNGWRGQGGGVSIGGGSAMFSMMGGEITGNEVLNESGAVNHEGRGGGGVFIHPQGTFNMEGGIIAGNTIPAGSDSDYYKGKGIYVSSDGRFNMSGSAVVAPDNDVYLASTAMITITGNLTGTAPVATITPGCDNLPRPNTNEGKPIYTQTYPTAVNYDDTGAPPNNRLLVTSLGGGGGGYLSTANLNKLAVTQTTTPPSWSTGGWVWKLAGSTGCIPADTANYGRLWVGGGSNSINVGGIENITFTFSSWSDGADIIKHGSTFEVAASSSGTLNTNNISWSMRIALAGDIHSQTITSSPLTATQTFTIPSGVFAGITFPSYATITIIFTNSIASYSVTKAVTFVP
ncbi:MAG: bacterial Ig-like domain-containing protein [Spirochaetaceae bacterium]|jgi:hypothetical protein|nr:bacterial Ig-like domain-containing protein [Spirochaetaceae bacterium]